MSQAAEPRADTAAWLTLLRVPDLGPRRARRLLALCGGPRAALEAGEATWRRAGLADATVEGLRAPDTAGVERDLAWLDQAGHHLLLADDPAYPPRLREIDDAPTALFVLGDPDALHCPQLAVVGSRKPTAGGRDNARAFARHLAGWGLGITSGLAQGVDTAAHEGALDAGGVTVAVMATGPDRVYPARNRALAHRIAEGGALVTEFPTGTGPRPEHFPRRNRIISALATGTLVVEAGQRSGSLITAHCALDQGREVFAIPGSIHNPLARGCHDLIRGGAAKLVDQARDILEELPGLVPETWGRAPAPPAEPDGAPGPVDTDHQAVLDALGHDPVATDTVVQRTGLTADTVSSILLILELEGRVTPVPGGRYMRAGADS